MTDKILALAASELRVLLRNRTVAVTSVLTPLALGLFWVFTTPADDPAGAALVVALQLAVTFAMGVYVASTLTVVARRRARVLKRMRTSGLSDVGLLVALVTPCVVVGAAQLVVFAAVDVVAGVALPVEPLPLVFALLGGTALAVGAGLATTIVTPSPERAQITTMPLTFVLLGSVVALVLLPTDGAWRALLALPGAGVADLTRLAFTGGAWAAGPAGLPALLPAVLALAAWTAAFGWLARRRFRWDDRSA